MQAHVLTANPFTEATSPAAFAKREASDPAEPAYALVQSRPAVDLAEVELADVATVEVLIQWGTTVLHVEHLTPPRSFYIGEEKGPGVTCDYLVPAEKIGTTRAPIVLVEDGRTCFVVPAGARGTIEVPGQPTVVIKDAIRLGRGEPCAELTGAQKIVLAPGAKARVEHGGFAFQVSAARAGKAVGAGFFASRDPSSVIYAGLSLLAHASVMGAMALFVPPMGIDDEETAKRDQQYLMQQYLTSIAERERMDKEATAETAAPNPDDREGGSGDRHKGEEGTMGKPNSTKIGHKYAVQGSAAPEDTYLARQRAVRDAGTFGLIGLLSSGASGDRDAPTSPFGRDQSLGSDALSANGNMWGDTFGESVGGNGLGLSGIGEGGGGPGEGVGLGCITGLGTCGLGHGMGGGIGDGIGRGTGRLSRGHVVQAPSVRLGVTDVKGRLPAEIIQRIVRQNYGRFRACYESGLRTNPGLSGRVATRFVIGRDGAVSNVSNGDSDLPDSSVVSCVVRSYYGLTFPSPENGIVTVVYPIMFTPGG